jgi:hypothetical protein
MAKDNRWRLPKKSTPETIEARKKERRFREQLELIAEYLDEDAFVQVAKEFDPSPEELREWIMPFSAKTSQTRNGERIRRTGSMNTSRTRASTP